MELKPRGSILEALEMIAKPIVQTEPVHSMNQPTSVMIARSSLRPIAIMIALTIGAAVLTTFVAYFGGSVLPADVRVKILVNGLMLEFATLMLILMLAGDIRPRLLKLEYPYLRLTRRGLFSRDNCECHLKDIRAIEVQQSAVARLIGYGSIRIKRGSGEDFIRIDRVASPESVRAQLRQLTEVAR